MSEEKTETGLAHIDRGTSLMGRIASRYGVDGGKLYECLRDTAFKTKPGEKPASQAQMMALMIVADQYNLNPFTKEIYAFPDKRDGIVPVVGVDGWARIINEHPAFDGVKFEQTEDECKCSIFRKDRKYPIEVTEYLDECKRNTQPWGSHPRRMLRHKALIQCARLAFGFGGIHDQDEAERILEAHDIEVGPARPIRPEVEMDAAAEQLRVAREAAKDAGVPDDMLDEGMTSSEVYEMTRAYKESVAEEATEKAPPADAPEQTEEEPKKPKADHEVADAVVKKAKTTKADEKTLRMATLEAVAEKMGQDKLAAEVDEMLKNCDSAVERAAYRKAVGFTEKTDLNTADLGQLKRLYCMMMAEKQAAEDNGQKNMSFA